MKEANEREIKKRNQERRENLETKGSQQWESKNVVAEK